MRFGRGIGTLTGMARGPTVTSDARPDAAAPLLAPQRRRRPAVYRHPGDVFRVVVGLAVLAWLSVVAAGGVVTGPERDVFRLLNDLPDWLDGPMRVVTQAGWVGAVPVAAAVAIVLRRRRAALDLALAGSAAWLLAKVVKDLAHRSRPGVLLDDVILRGVPATGHGFVSGHAAVAAALATVASSEVSRRARRWLWMVVWATAAARVYSGAHLPLDVLGGAALGWALGAAVHLVRGTPAHPPSTAGVGAALARAGLDVADVRPLTADARGSHPFVGAGVDGAVFIKAVGRDQRDADVLFRLGRWLAFREIGDEAPLATAKQQIEHEAYLLLAAARAGARVPELLTTAEADGGTWLLAELRVAGTDGTSAVLDDDVLADLWQQVVALRARRIAHRDLRLANVVVDPDGRAWLVDFGFAQAGAADDQLARDVAELLTSIATAVGATRAVAAAVAAVGPAGLQSAAPFLQPLALSTATRRSVAAQPGLLAALRDEMAGCGVPADRPSLLRVPVRPAMLVAVAAGGYITHHLLIGAAGGSAVAAVLDGIGWRWVAAAALAGALQFVFAALALAAAAGRPLALGRTVAGQLAATFASRGSASGRGSTDVSIAYLGSVGMTREDAADAVHLTRAAGFAVHATALGAVTAVALGSGLRLVEPPRPAALVVAGLAVAIVAGALGWLSAGRRALARAVLGRLVLLRRLLTERRRGTRLVVSQLGLTASLAAALLASLRAIDAAMPVAAVVAVYLAAVVLAANGPLPGGLGVVEPAVVAGLMVLAVPAAPAVVSVVVFRAVTYWLPLLPGAVAFRRLRRQGCC